MLKSPVTSMVLIRQLLVMAAVLTLPISPLLSGNAYASPPDTTINSGPTDPSADTTPTFTFSSTDSPVTFECYVDSNSPAPCVSPYTTTPLTSGPHRFTVQAVNASNEVDLSPAYIIWSVAAYDGGVGTSGDPYQISTCAQLQTLESNLTASFVLAADIDCTGDSFRPIGVDGDPFSGNFDGRVNDGIFSKLKDLKVGDTYTVETGNGATKRFKVISLNTTSVKDAANYLFSQDPKVSSQLNLITCAGTFNANAGGYDQRLIVASVYLP